ncbi:MAG: LytR/AlgR family response regulator transcription factor [Chitinophagaceae bacterium]
MKLRCLLVDDEPPALEVLSTYASAIKGLEITGVCHNAFDALEVLQHKHVDVIFLDIKMPLIIGTQFLKNLAHPPKVIFVTAYREYAIESYELDAVDYLIKPVSFERFFKAITKLNRIMGAEPSEIDSRQTTKEEVFVYLKVDKDMRKIYVNEIDFIESSKDYVTVNLEGGIRFLVKQSISSMENLLSEHKFLRVHRSFIVSLQKVKGYNGLSVLLPGKEIPIGRLFKQTVMERLRTN